MTTFYSVHTGHAVDPDGYPDEFITDVKPPAPGYKFVDGRWIAAEAVIDTKLHHERKRIFDRINTRVMELYNLYTPLQMEYLEREKQALEWRASGYTGETPPQIRAFSGPARMNPVEACNLIIYQANAFREALNYVSVLRMRKHGVDNASTLIELREYEKSTLSQIDYVTNTLP